MLIYVNAIKFNVYNLTIGLRAPGFYMRAKLESTATSLKWKRRDLIFIVRTKHKIFKKIIQKHDPADIFF